MSRKEPRKLDGQRAKRKSEKIRHEVTGAPVETGGDSSGSGSSSSGSSDIASSGLSDILRTLAPLICLVGFLSYFAWFLLSPMRHGMLDQEGEPWLRFETILLLSQTPLGDYLSIWTGGGNAPLSVIDRWPIVLTAGFIIGVSYAAGWLLMDLLGLSRRLHPLETSLFSIGVGLNFLSLLTLILGLLGLLHFPAVFVVILLTVVGAAAARARGGFPKRELEREVIVEESAAESICPWPPNRSTLAWTIWAIVCLPFALLIVWGGMLPPWDFDVREYHLQVPKEWYLNGRITSMPHNIYGNMPLGAELHSLLAMVLMPGDHAWWWGAMTGKTIMACFAPLTAMVLFCMGRRFFSSFAGAIAALIYISTPWVVKTGLDGLNEGAFAFYVVAAIFAFMLWAMEQRETNVVRCRVAGGSLTPLIILAGLLAGSAVACKYPGVIYSVLPLGGLILIWPFISNWANRRFQNAAIDDESTSGWLWRPCAVFLLCAALACGPWLLKNLVFTSNPVYPLLSGTFGTRTPEQIAQWQRAHQSTQFSLADLGDGLQVALLESTWLAPLSVSLALMALFATRGRSIALVLLGMWFVGFFQWWLLTHRIERFLVPLLPLLAILAGIGSTWCRERWWRMGLNIALVFNVVYCFQFAFGPVMLRSDQRFLVAMQPLKEGTVFENDFYRSRIDPVHRYLNAHRDEIGTLLLVGDAQPFDLEVPVLYNTCFDENLFELLLRDRDRDERFEALKEKNITHVYVHWAEIQRYRDTYGFTDFVTEDLVIAELVDQQKLLEPIEGVVDSSVPVLYRVVQ